MASISTAILCDYAQVRGNLLYLMSGGITRILTPKTPAPFNTVLALVIEVGPDELDQAHEVTVVIKHTATATDIVRFVGGFQSSEGETFPGEGLHVPLALDFRAAAVPEFGAYDIHTEVDGNIGPHLTCYVIEPADT